MAPVRLGWNLYFFSLFKKILDQLEADVTKIKSEKTLDEFKQHPKTKLLKSVFKQILTDVPTDPNDSKFKLGHTLGKNYSNWQRVKNGLPSRYRLFFKFSSTNKSIIYVWLNNETTLRNDGSKKDVYTVFLNMLKSGTIPSDIEELINQSNLYKPAQS